MVRTGRVIRNSVAEMFASTSLVVNRAVIDSILEHEEQPLPHVPAISVAANGRGCVAANGGDCVTANERGYVPANGGDCVAANGGDFVSANGGDCVAAYGGDCVVIENRV